MTSKHGVMNALFSVDPNTSLNIGVSNTNADAKWQLSHHSIDETVTAIDSDTTATLAAKKSYYSFNQHLLLGWSCRILSLQVLNTQPLFLCRFYHM